MNKDEALLARKSKRLKSRYAAERRFRLYGASAVSVACAFLFFLLFSIFSSGYSAFFGTFIEASVHFDTEALGITASSSAEELEDANYMLLAKRSLYAVFSEVTNRSEKRELSKMLSAYAGDALREKVAGNPNILGTTQRILLRASSEIDQLHKGNISKELSAERRSVSDRQLLWYNRLQSDSKIVKKFDWNFLTSGDSRAPEEAGIGGAMVGTVFSLIVCLLLSFPLGVAAAVYLEEFAPKNRITDLIEVNINNLAAVPSIIYGLLGLAVLLNVVGLPRSTPIAGGVVLALMTLPVIIIACRASLKAVPPSIRQGAMAMGASPMQVVLHHVLPLALPGTLTGAIIGLSRALGETAPLLMIGMVAFIVDVPSSWSEPATALPVQIYLWAESAERGFVEKTSAAIMAILFFLVCMNSTAVFLRSKFERRW